MTTHYSCEAEQAVLGSLLLDNSVYFDIDFLKPSYFYERLHRILFAHFLDQFNKKCHIDVLSFKTYLDSQSNMRDFLNDDFNYEAYLFRLANSTPSTSNAKEYANIVKHYAVKRNLVRHSNDVIKLCNDSNSYDVTGIMQSAESELFSLSRELFQNKRNEKSLSDILVEAINEVDERANSQDALIGISSGLPSLDEKTLGFQPGDLIILAARPAMGKTALALNFARTCAKEKRVAFFSLEMPAKSLSMRLLSMETRLPYNLLRTGKLKDEHFSELMQAQCDLSGLNMIIDDTPFLTTGELYNKCRHFEKEHGKLDMIMVDYLQLLEPSERRENRVQDVSVISRELKIMAKEFDIPVVSLAQLNRGLEQRQDKRPIMADIRDSGSIEQDADLILFLYRDEVYNKEAPAIGHSEIIIAKHRNGELGTIDCTFKPAISTFTDGYKRESTVYTSSDFTSSEYLQSRYG